MYNTPSNTDINLTHEVPDFDRTVGVVVHVALVVAHSSLVWAAIHCMLAGLYIASVILGLSKVAQLEKTAIPIGGLWQNALTNYARPYELDFGSE